MTNKIYCILHEGMYDLEEGPYCTGHAFIAYEDREIGLNEFDFHCAPFPLAYCPPPESVFDSIFDESVFDADDDHIWDEWCEDRQPSEEEIMISDLNAAELMEDLEQS